MFAAGNLTVDSEGGMGQAPISSRDENAIEASVVIRRPIEQVFDLYHDFKNLPSFLGDVMEIEQIDASTSPLTVARESSFSRTWEFAGNTRAGQCFRIDKVLITHFSVH